MGRSVLTGFLAGLGFVVLALGALSLMSPGPSRPGDVDVAVLEPAAEAAPADDATMGAAAQTDAVEPDATVAVIEPPPEPDPANGAAEPDAPEVSGKAEAGAEADAGTEALAAAEPAVAEVAEDPETPVVATEEPAAPADTPAEDAPPTVAAVTGETGAVGSAEPPSAPDASPDAAPAEVAAGADSSDAGDVVAADTSPDGPAIDSRSPATPDEPDTVAGVDVPAPQAADTSPPKAPWVAETPAPAPGAPAAAEVPAAAPQALVEVTGPDAPLPGAAVAEVLSPDAAAPAPMPIAVAQAPSADPAPVTQIPPPPAPVKVAEAPVAKAPAATETAEAVPDTTEAAPEAAEAPPQAAEPAPDTAGNGEIAEAPAQGDGAALPVIISPDGTAGPRSTADAPKPGLRNAAGVKVNRLPTIGSGEASTGPDASGTGQVADAPAAAAPDLPPVARFAAKVDNPDQRPVLGVVLIDLGEDKGGLDPATIASLKAPVTVAVDPTRPDAADRAATFRAAGFEVAILVPDLPAGASASDAEVMFQGWQEVLPEAVGLVTAPGSKAETDRKLVQHLVALAGAGGLGLVTSGTGLNPAAQLAGPAGVKYARAFRWLDGKGENAEAVRRGMDRGVFEAEREGAALVLATSRPETITALFGWLSGAGQDVLTGPATAVLK